MDKLTQAKETYGFTNVWANDGKILFKSDSNAKPQVCYSYFFIILIRPSIRRQRLSYESFGGFFICSGHCESILFIVSIFIFFVLCFLRFYGNTSLKYCFEFLYQKNAFYKYLFIFQYFSLYYLFVKKNILNFDKSKLFLINSIPSVLLVINHIEILPLNTYLFNKRDIIKNFDIT